MHGAVSLNSTSRRMELSEKFSAPRGSGWSLAKKQAPREHQGKADIHRFATSYLEAIRKVEQT